MISTKPDWTEIPPGLSPGWHEYAPDNTELYATVHDCVELVGPTHGAERWGWSVFNPMHRSLSGGYCKTLEIAKAEAEESLWAFDVEGYYR